MTRAATLEHHTSSTIQMPAQLVASDRPPLCACLSISRSAIQSPDGQCRADETQPKGSHRHAIAAKQAKSDERHYQGDGATGQRDDE